METKNCVHCDEMNSVCECYTDDMTLYECIKCDKQNRSTEMMFNKNGLNPFCRDCYDGEYDDKVETPKMKKCGKCGKCEMHDPDMENSYHGNSCCDIMYCEDCDCDCEEDDDDDDEWEACYGVKTTKTKVYIMAGGGSHWWNYVVEFDDKHGEQIAVYIENKDGREQQFRMRLAYRHNKDSVEELRLVPLDWQPDEDKDEGLLTY